MVPMPTSLLAARVSASLGARGVGRDLPVLRLEVVADGRASSECVLWTPRSGDRGWRLLRSGATGSPGEMVVLAGSMLGVDWAARGTGAWVASAVDAAVSRPSELWEALMVMES